MGRLVLSMMSTLDGYIAGPDNGLDWVIWEKEMDRDASVLLQKSDAFLVGYGAYKDMANYWPAAQTKPSSKSEGEFAKLINQKRKIVVSDRDSHLLWQNDELLLVSNLKQQITSLKSQHQTIVAYGGVALAQFLVREALVDSFDLIVSPVALGSGKRLFENLREALLMQDVTVKQYQSGAFRLYCTTKI